MTGIAAAVGIAIAWIFRRLADRKRAAQAKRQMRARLYAMRLYAGEPAAVFRAQKELLAWNARYLALMLRPAAIIAIPMILLFTQLAHVYGSRALAPGESAIVTAAFGTAADMAAPALSGRGGIVVETPAVRLMERREACWRVRATGVADGHVDLCASGSSASLAVASGPGLHYLAARHTVSQGGPLRWIEVAYPPAHLQILGYDIPWVLWFVTVSLLCAAAASL